MNALKNTRLLPREKTRIEKLISEGHTQQHTAERLGRSITTIKRHIKGKELAQYLNGSS